MFRLGRRGFDAVRLIDFVDDKDDAAAVGANGPKRLLPPVGFRASCRSYPNHFAGAQFGLDFQRVHRLPAEGVNQIGFSAPKFLHFPEPR